MIPSENADNLERVKTVAGVSRVEGLESGRESDIEVQNAEV
jgi:hypothetical protein